MNRLARETSPYLLQHKANPVDWYPWGEEALSRARAENKPILLSIGYSACHWCHVMEHESFESPEIARLMNDKFVNIKVDREERPDLDQIYQNVAQALTRSGGWPLTVFLTPELKPFFGGTYFPPEDRYGRPGFARVLTALSDAFHNEPQSVAENAEKLTSFIQSLETVPRETASGSQTPPSMDQLRAAVHQIVEAMDPVLGGLKGAPKFPNPMLLSFLLRFASITGDEASRQAALTTLTRMALAGIFDQLGGGFHRYSVDEFWSVPHFEKMLYDNGLLLRAYSEALCLGLPEEQRELYLDRVRMTVDYLIREMRSPEGAFYSSQDADSEGEEGRFFVWSPEDLASLVSRKVISPEEARSFASRYGVNEKGNFENGATVLSLARPRDPETQELADSARGKLFVERSKRVAPATDHKILASWNGLAISGLAWAAQALRIHGESAASDRALKAALDAYACVRTRMSRPGGRLFSTLQEGTPKLNAYLDDYAFMAMAALDLSRFAQDAPDGYLATAREWVETILHHFRGDGTGAGFFFTSDDHEALIHRPKTVFDQAIPSGTAVALTVMTALGEALEDAHGYSAQVQRELARLAPLVERAALGLGELLSTCLLFERGPVTVSGARSYELCRHAHVFRKPGAPSPILVCHRQSCMAPQASLSEAWALVQSLI